MTNRIRECRKAAGLSQKYVSVTLGIAGPSISNWESGKTNPSHDNLVRLAALYGVTVDYLLGLDDAPAQAQEKAPASPLDAQIMKELEGADVELAREVLNYIRFRKQGG